MAYPHTAVGVVAYYHKPNGAYLRAAPSPVLMISGAPDGTIPGVPGGAAAGTLRLVQVGECKRAIGFTTG